MLVRFLLYGLAGWCVEIFFTGVAAALWKKDRSATGVTYLWMHPIYGGTALLMEAAHDHLAWAPMLVRALVYVLIIYAAEYLAGWVLAKTLGKCPWEYCEGLNLSGLIRLDYAPAWFLLGLLFEPLRGVLSAFVASPQIAGTALSLLQ